MLFPRMEWTSWNNNLYVVSTIDLRSINLYQVGEIWVDETGRQIIRDWCS